MSECANSCLDPTNVNFQCYVEWSIYCLVQQQAHLVYNRIAVSSNQLLQTFLCVQNSQVRQFFFKL